MYTTPGSRGYLSGLGAIVVDSVTTTGAVAAGSVAATGAVTGATLKATTDGTAAAPSINCNDRGGVYGAATPSMNFASPLGTNSQTLTSGATTQNGTMSASVINAGVRIRADLTALQTITAVGDTITYTGTFKRLASDGSRTLTSTPPIALGVAGDYLDIGYEGANTLTISDVATCNLGAATRALSAGDRLGLVMNAAGTAWEEIYFANN